MHGMSIVHWSSMDNLLTAFFIGIGGLLAALAYVLLGSKIRHRLQKDSLHTTSVWATPIFFGIAVMQIEVEGNLWDRCTSNQLGLTWNGLARKKRTLQESLVLITKIPNHPRMAACKITCPICGHVSPNQYWRDLHMQSKHGGDRRWLLVWSFTPFSWLW